jgi:hypothetical protein
MRAVIADAVGGRMYSPASQMIPAVSNRRMEPGAVYAPERPIESPPGIAAIDAIVQAHLPMPKPGRRITTAELIAETEAKLKDLKEQLAAEEAEEKKAKEKAKS